jgi:Glycosyl transferases group 1
MTKLALYPIYENSVVQPHYTIQRAFEAGFDCKTFDWYNRSKKVGLRSTQLEFIKFLQRYKPKYAFMQLQNPANMNAHMMKEIARYTKVVTWSGDVRGNREWYQWLFEMGKIVHLSLFSNNTDVDILRNKGLKADYLQIGVDHNWYFPDYREKKGPKIVFSAHHYGIFQLSDYRLKCATALKEEFGDDFKLYGSRWPKEIFGTTTISGCHEEAEAYRNAEIGISVSNMDMKNYHSDRLLRIMACDCLALSHDYQGVEQDYRVGTDLITFTDPNDLVDRCKQYLADKEAAKQIRANAIEVILTSCLWKHRIEELKQVLAKYE